MVGTDYKHELLKSRVDTDRRFNVSSFCRKEIISREHFYSILSGETYVSRDRLTRIIIGLGLNPDEIINSPSDEKHLAEV